LAKYTEKNGKEQKRKGKIGEGQQIKKIFWMSDWMNGSPFRRSEWMNGPPFRRWERIPRSSVPTSGTD